VYGDEVAQVARTAGSAAEETRQRILATAAELFVERGYAATSIRELSERLGMTKGALYYHFASKEELLSALVAPLFEAVDEFVAAARASGQVTRELVRRLVDVLDAHAPMLRSFLGDPTAKRLRLEKPAGFVELVEVLGGGPNSAAKLRARCALGVIHAGVLAPRPEDFEPRTGVDCGQPMPLIRAEPLSEAERAFVVEAAMAVLAVSLVP
jgi:AcrR family transcriptional regulator